MHQIDLMFYLDCFKTVVKNLFEAIGLCFSDMILIKRTLKYGIHPKPLVK